MTGFIPNIYGNSQTNVKQPQEKHVQQVMTTGNCIVGQRSMYKSQRSTCAMPSVQRATALLDLSSVRCQVCSEHDRFDTLRMV